MDTPAIGNYMEFRTTLMENVSEAVVFVIVIDASKAWESHRDRVKLFKKYIYIQHIVFVKLRHNTITLPWC